MTTETAKAISKLNTRYPALFQLCINISRSGGTAFQQNSWNRYCKRARSRKEEEKIFVFDLVFPLHGIGLNSHSHLRIKTLSKLFSPAAFQQYVNSAAGYLSLSTSVTAEGHQLPLHVEKEFSVGSAISLRCCCAAK